MNVLMDFSHKRLRHMGLYVYYDAKDITELYQVYIVGEILHTTEVITGTYRRYDQKGSESLACRLVRVTKQQARKRARALREAADSIDSILK